MTKEQFDAALTSPEGIEYANLTPVVVGMPLSALYFISEALTVFAKNEETKVGPEDREQIKGLAAQIDNTIANELLPFLLAFEMGEGATLVAAIREMAANDPRFSEPTFPRPLGVPFDPTLN